MAKRLLMIGLILVVGVGIAFAGGQGESDSKSIAVIMPGATHGFLGESIRHAEDATETIGEARGYEYQFLISDDVVQQANQIDTVVSQGVDVVVLWPHNGDELRSAAQQILDAGIPLVVYDRLITDFDENAELMGDNVTIGEETGEYFNEYFAEELAEGQVNILEFKGDNSTVPTQRSEGFWSTAHDNFNVVNEYVTNWSRDTAQTQMETFLNSSDEATVESIEAIFTHDAEVQAGVMAALEGYSGAFDINVELVSGVSAPRELLENFDRYQEQGIDQVTFAFSPAMVRDAIELGYDILDGETVSGMHLVETEMVDNSNYEEFMEGDVFTTRYSVE
ncbi:MAG: substrate-binding domain-containing protein [Spirochaeta sp.]|jgi:ribose transport system substrate-binding protein|nr:substrate-binding domain-containing protein [Spirochaeta sp.]